MALTQAAAHINANTAGQTSSGEVQPSQLDTYTAPVLHVVSDAGELGPLLFGHTLSSNVPTDATESTALQTTTGGFVPKAQAALASVKTYAEGIDPTVLAKAQAARNKVESAGNTPTIVDTVRGEATKLATNAAALRESLKSRVSSLTNGRINL